MTENLKKACEDYEKMLLNAAEYSGNKEPGKKIYSASMLGNTILQNYLKFKHTPSNQNTFKVNTIGSLYQLGVDTAADMYNEQFGSRYKNATRMQYELKNGWIISGETDQFDTENGVIFDNKVTTSTAIAKIHSEGKYNSYALQMAVYRWLMWKETGEKYEVVLPMIDKGYSDFKENKNLTLNFKEPEIFDVEEIELILIEKTNELQSYIDLDMEPEECSVKDKWIYSRKGKPARAMRCLFYCDQKRNCKYISDYNQFKNLLDL